MGSCWELQLLEGGVSRFCESEEGKCYDVSYASSVVVFKTDFHKLIHRPFDDKHRLPSHEKLSFQMTNVICVIQGTSQQDQKIIFLSPWTTVHIFLVQRSYGVHWKGCDLGTWNFLLNSTKNKLPTPDLTFRPKVLSFNKPRSHWWIHGPCFILRPFIIKFHILLSTLMKSGLSSPLVTSHNQFSI